MRDGEPKATEKVPFKADSDLNALATVILSSFLRRFTLQSDIIEQLYIKSQVLFIFSAKLRVLLKTGGRAPCFLHFLLPKKPFFRGFFSKGENFHFF